MAGRRQGKWERLQTQSTEERRIDVWWQEDATSRLLLLAYLITRHESWEGAAIRVLSVVYDENTPENMEDLKKKLEEARITAEPVIVPAADMQLSRLKTEADKAESEADKAFRKGAKAQAKEDQAARDLKELDPGSKPKEAEDS
jgi:hypothetical protein